MKSIFETIFPDIRAQRAQRDIEPFIKPITRRETIYLVSAEELTGIDFDPYQIEDYSIQKIMRVNLDSLSQEKGFDKAYRISRAYKSVGYQVQLVFQAVVQDGQLQDKELGWRLVVSPPKKALPS